MQKEQGGGLHACEAGSVPLRNPPARQHCARGARARFQGRAGAIDDRNRREISNRPPMTPEMELAQVVGAHDPDEMGAGRPALEPEERVIRKVRADLRFDVGDHDAWADVELCARLRFAR